MEILKNQDNEKDQLETKEWLDALYDIIIHDGSERAAYLIKKQISFARIHGVSQLFYAETPYINTISPEQQQKFSGNIEIEEKIRAYTCWNAMAIVLRANKNENIGGHISSFQSAAMLYDIGYNYFWHARSNTHTGDLIFFQGHSAPGIYARSYLMDRLTEQQLDNFRQEVDCQGLSSYPHPWLMPNFWQFPTVSMGLGPIMAIYQARFMRYLEDHGLSKTKNRKVWAFLGDGETDEPESLGAIGVAGREHLDNLCFVINCNLQRLDGPVRGNGKIIQELENIFRGAGWNVIKIIWSSHWDILFSRDKNGILIKRLGEIVDGEYQTLRSKNGSYMRQYIFNTPELKQLISDWSDEDIWNLNYGGHDPYKVYAAFYAAVHHKGQPTVILAKTVKGYGMGSSGEAMNTAHQTKKMNDKDILSFKDRFRIPISDNQIGELPYVNFSKDSKESKYMHEKRAILGGSLLPFRQTQSENVLKIPTLDQFISLIEKIDSKHEISTTMVFVRLLNFLLKDKDLGKYIIPIVPDELRTFGMEGILKQFGIWSHIGQLYTPEDRDQLLYYKEDQYGQILQEGINEAGAMCDWIAAATAYSTHNVSLLPFYIFYSMFGFQRIGDLAWAASDMRSRGFLLGAIAGRTTLNGEGLQHQDGHSLLWSSSIPNCVSYDPCFAFELAVIIQNGLHRMVTNQEDIYYYITLMNENYNHPYMPKDINENLLKGMYHFTSVHDTESKLRVQLLGSGTIFREILSAASILQNEWSVSSDVWSCPSFTELSRDWNQINRYNLLHPLEKKKKSHVEKMLASKNGPVIAASDYMRLFADQIRPAIQSLGKQYTVLGTDGFGRSDTRESLRHFFEIDRYWIVVSSLKSLADNQQISYQIVENAIKKYKLDKKKPNPMTV